ncbi:MAG: hypothetical protein H0T73_13875 [Ardenticatenales bacterium]|nr:hypothetical protein [Ardenticatenales bacterium]
MSSLVYKIATEPWEFEQIHRLNYRTFVEEIPQHTSNPEGRLVDKFHEQNSYIICLDGQALLGMVAVRGERPFSLDSKLENLDSYLPPGRSLCEIRLLAIVPSRRQATILGGIMAKSGEYIFSHEYDLALISGTVRQEKLYRRFGFEPFGPLVGTAEALYQPMYLRKERVPESAAWLEKARAKLAADTHDGGLS